MGDMGFALELTGIALGALVAVSLIFIALSRFLQWLATGNVWGMVTRWRAPAPERGGSGYNVGKAGVSNMGEPPPSMVAMLTGGTEAPSQAACSSAEQTVTRDIRERIVTSPLPGTIISILVKVGDPVTTGDVLLVLESMKIQNEIKSPRDGVVKDIHVSQGANVRRAERLITIAG